MVATALQVEEFVKTIPLRGSHAQVPRGVALYNLCALQTLQPVQVRREVRLQLNGTSMFNGALEKLEHLRQDVTHEFRTRLFLGTLSMENLPPPVTTCQYIWVANVTFLRTDPANCLSPNVVTPCSQHFLNLRVLIIPAFLIFLFLGRILPCELQNLL